MNINTDWFANIAKLPIFIGPQAYATIWLDVGIYIFGYISAVMRTWYISDHITPLYLACGWLNTYQRFFLHLCCPICVHNALHINTSSYLRDCLRFNHEFHFSSSTDTRFQSLLSYPLYRPTTFQAAFSYVAVKSQLLIPFVVLSSSAFTTFKSTLSKLIASNF